MTVHVSNFGLDENSDDRTEYASIQAILYGPCLLAGHTTSDWDIKNVAADSLSEWITPIPAAHNDHLLRRNSAETKDSISRRSSGDFERAARKKPRYRLSTCFCIPESLALPPVDGPIENTQCTSLIRFWSSKALINKENNISRLCCILSNSIWPLGAGSKNIKAVKKCFLQKQS
ncbi:hypothetical protein DKX38_000119 [Salix brachista]|uniref:Uncharacterized protein n=1 Tax=Salix brachista TaxID=2182728 RepID=A0A5N5P041_9ROSI|nr:hypothetical protein DKX38_000119 [Salix brachista]